MKKDRKDLDKHLIQGIAVCLNKLYELNQIPPELVDEWIDEAEKIYEDIHQEKLGELDD